MPEYSVFRKPSSGTCVMYRTVYCATMATNLDVNLEALAELVELGQFASKRAAVDQAVREAIAWRRQLASREALASIDFESILLPPVPGAERS